MPARAASPCRSGARPLRFTESRAARVQAATAERRHDRHMYVRWVIVVERSIPALSRRTQAAPLKSVRQRGIRGSGGRIRGRSEEHTSELQSQSNLVCRLLLEKKKSDI